jgi:hypothetical protein
MINVHPYTNLNLLMLHILLLCVIIILLLLLLTLCVGVCKRFRPVVLKVCAADPRRSVATLKSTIFFN